MKDPGNNKPRENGRPKRTCNGPSIDLILLVRLQFDVGHWPMMLSLLLLFFFFLTLNAYLICRKVNGILFYTSLENRYTHTASTRRTRGMSKKQRMMKCLKFFSMHNELILLFPFLSFCLSDISSKCFRDNLYKFRNKQSFPYSEEFHFFYIISSSEKHLISSNIWYSRIVPLSNRIR